ncbi:MAG: HlyD family secretion protein [Sediminibacterium sp.]|jgi:membrane fusion protein (multidrug efflux system)|nr:HlyD family secretion protein [Sediminibacterium sp.]
MYSIKYVPFYFILSLLTGCGNAEKTDNAQLETNISPVIPKINSTVLQVLVEDNQKVMEGDTLILLDDASYKIAVSQAETALAQAKQQVLLATNSKNAASSTVVTAAATSGSITAALLSAKAAVEAAKVKAALSTKNFERIENLYLQTSATQQQFDIAKAEMEGTAQALQIAEGELLSVQKQATAAQSQVITSQSGVATSMDNIVLAELGVKQALHALEMAKLQLSYCTITAPSNGIVSKKNVQKGQVVSPGQPLMAITDDQEVWVIANFKETQLEDIQVGQNAEIHVDAYSEKTFIGTVSSIAQATGAKFSLLPPDNATGNFVKVTQRIPVKIKVNIESQGNYPLRAGMSASVRIKK